MSGLRNVVCLSILTVLAGQSGLAQTLPSKATSASPELIGQLTKELSITPAQATGGAGALFSLAKTHLSPADFKKIAAAVPGMNNLLKAAPSSDETSELSSLAGALPGGMGDLALTAGSFQKLGLSPDMVGKFMPILMNFVQSKGGANLASLLSGALKGSQTLDQ
jgi:hypothetical protein